MLATVINPNAFIGVRAYNENTKLARKVELDVGHLFGKWNRAVEFVFNPPWLPIYGGNFENLDIAIYYPPDLFFSFFEQVSLRLLPKGLVAVIFSNLAEVFGLTKTNPVKTELENYRCFELVQNLTRKVRLTSGKTRRNAFWREAQEVELWVLKPNQY